jgi:UDP-2,3-diacylglucosamine hydrolase
MLQLFISDLHLCEQAPQIEALFHQFMEQQAAKADELYVLGDLFEAWIGDDSLEPLAERVITAFNQYSSQGGKLYFMHGNRDFLLGENFVNATGGQLLNDPHALVLAGQSSLLMHGDSLCTEDKEYIAFRSLVRDPQWQQQFLSLSINERINIAKDIRSQSKERGKTLSEEISDVTPAEVINIMQHNQVSLLIHGHTHRQARHNLTIEKLQSERIVLGDWGVTGSVLSISEKSIELSNFTLDS